MGESVTRLAPRMIGACALVFGVMTLVSGGSHAFEVGIGRADGGNYVPFVLYFNFLSGFAYIAAGIGIVLRRRWARVVATAIVAGIVVAGGVLGLHALSGGAFATKTVIALTLRLVIWLAIAGYTWTRFESAVRREEPIAPVQP